MSKQYIQGLQMTIGSAPSLYVLLDHIVSEMTRQDGSHQLKHTRIEVLFVNRRV